MSYVRTDTSNPLGRRNLGRLAWDSAPYPLYPQPRSMTQLNGIFNPAGPDPSTSTQGAITYRIDPQTGKYQFYRTDIKPRGVFMQNTFQHPAPPLMSALGVPIGRSGLGCGSCKGKCGRRCSKKANRRGIGDSTSVLSPDASIVRLEDGTIIDTANDRIYKPDGSVTDSQGNVIIGATPVSQRVQQIAQQIAPLASSQLPRAQSWWDGYTMIGGTRVPNPVLAAGGVGFLFLLASIGGRR